MQVTSNVRGHGLVLGEGWVALFVLVASESELSSFATFVAWSWFSTTAARRMSHTEGVVPVREGVVLQFAVITNYFGKL